MQIAVGLSLLGSTKKLLRCHIKPAFLVPYFSEKYKRNYSSIIMKRAAVFLAPGYEEIEFITCVDVLRRGGVDVTVAGLDGKEAVKGRSNVLILPDVALSEVVDHKFDALILPGGLGGTKAMAGSAKVGEMLKKQETDKKIIAAICAAPIALKTHGIGKGKSLTSYPSTEKDVNADKDYVYKSDDVVVDDYLITSRGPATAMKFALAVLKNLTDDNKTSEVAKGLLSQ